jgi:DNA polymerase-4
MRSILHIDMDAFFASVEQRDNPALRGKPVIVGAPRDQRGVVSTCSYEARVFGVHSAMPSRTAAKLCPQGIFITPDFHRYSEASHKVMAIIGR